MCSATPVLLPHCGPHKLWTAKSLLPRNVGVGPGARLCKALGSGRSWIIRPQGLSLFVHRAPGRREGKCRKKQRQASVASEPWKPKFIWELYPSVLTSERLFSFTGFHYSSFTSVSLNGLLCLASDLRLSFWFWIFKEWFLISVRWVKGGRDSGRLGQRWLWCHGTGRPLILGSTFSDIEKILVNQENFPLFSPRTQVWVLENSTNLWLFCVFFRTFVEKVRRLHQGLILRSHFKPDATGLVLKQKSFLAKVTQLSFLFCFAMISENSKMSLFSHRSLFKKYCEWLK